MTIKPVEFIWLSAYDYNVVFLCANVKSEDCIQLMSNCSYIDKSILNWLRFIEHYGICVELLVMAMGKGLIISNWKI